VVAAAQKQKVLKLLLKHKPLLLQLQNNLPLMLHLLNQLKKVNERCLIKPKARFFNLAFFLPTYVVEHQLLSSTL
jgi:hypothetical protein